MNWNDPFEHQHFFIDKNLREAAIKFIQNGNKIAAHAKGKINMLNYPNKPSYILTENQIAEKLKHESYDAEFLLMHLCHRFDELRKSFDFTGEIDGGDLKSNCVFVKLDSPQTINGIRIGEKIALTRIN